MKTRKIILCLFMVTVILFMGFTPDNSNRLPEKIMNSCGRENQFVKHFPGFKLVATC
jgi:hypothetical protein